MKYHTKSEALSHVSDNPKIAVKQLKMIDMMYEYDMCVSQADLDNIALDAHKDLMRSVMAE